MKQKFNIPGCLAGLVTYALAIVAGGLVVLIIYLLIWGFR